MSWLIWLNCSQLFEDYHIFKRTELEETPEKTAESVDVDRILDGEPKVMSSNNNK